MEGMTLVGQVFGFFLSKSPRSCWEAQGWCWWEGVGLRWLPSLSITMSIFGEKTDLPTSDGYGSLAVMEIVLYRWQVERKRTPPHSHPHLAWATSQSTSRTVYFCC